MILNNNYGTLGFTLIIYFIYFVISFLQSSFWERFLFSVLVCVVNSEVIGIFLWFYIRVFPNWKLTQFFSSFASAIRNPMRSHCPWSGAQRPASHSPCFSLFIYKQTFYFYRNAHWFNSLPLRQPVYGDNLYFLYSQIGSISQKNNRLQYVQASLHLVES